MILTAVFAESVGLIHGQTETFLNHLLALLVVIPFTIAGSAALYFISHRIIPMRVSEFEESLGLDQSQHGEAAEARVRNDDNEPSSLLVANIGR
jgi:Amt family ammonium transporter